MSETCRCGSIEECPKHPKGSLGANLHRAAYELNKLDYGASSRLTTAIECVEKAIEQTAPGVAWTQAEGHWEHCSPELIDTGYDCGNGLRRVCQCPDQADGVHFHDHFVPKDAPLKVISKEEYAECVAVVKQIMRDLPNRNWTEDYAADWIAFHVLEDLVDFRKVFPHYGT